MPFSARGAAPHADRTSVATPPADRAVGLDGLRAIAAAMVFTHHLLPTLAGPGANKGLDVGVMIFFVLSGFLLYRPFVAGSVPIGSFAVRRIARILPAYLVAAFAIGWLFAPAYLANPLAVATMTATPIDVVWTLRIELVFYAALPFLGLITRRLPMRGRMLVLAWFGLVSLALGFVAAPGATDVPTGYALWAFVPGMVLAELSVGRPDLLRRRLRLAVVGLVLISISVVTERPFPDPAGGIGAALLLPLFASWRPGRAASLVTAAGAISYSVYLWHLPLVRVLGLASIPATVVIASVVYLVVERPGMQAGRFIAEHLASPATFLSRSWKPAWTNRRAAEPTSLLPVADSL